MLAGRVDTLDSVTDFLTSPLLLLSVVTACVMIVRMPRDFANDKVMISAAGKAFAACFGIGMGMWFFTGWWAEWADGWFQAGFVFAIGTLVIGVPFCGDGTGCDDDGDAADCRTGVQETAGPVRYGVTGADGEARYGAVEWPREGDGERVAGRDSGQDRLRPGMAGDLAAKVPA